MMKIMFLDIDGPMLPARAWIDAEGDGPFKRWDPVAVRMVNRLLADVPDLQIVVSSTWGHALGQTDFFIHLSLNGIPSHRVHEDWATQHGRTRNLEIHQWLEDHEGDVETWFAFDDMEVDGNPVSRVDFVNGISLEQFNEAGSLFSIRPFRVL